MAVAGSNIDSVIVAERPKLKLYIKTMRDRLSTTLELNPDEYLLPLLLRVLCVFVVYLKGILCVFFALFALKKSFKAKRLGAGLENWQAIADTTACYWL